MGNFLSSNQWSTHKMYLCDNPSCSNGDSVEIENIFTDSMDSDHSDAHSDALSNSISLIPKLQNVDDFGDDIPWISNLHSPFGGSMWSIFDRMMNQFNGFKSDWYRRNGVEVAPPEYDGFDD